MCHQRRQSFFVPCTSIISIERYSNEAMLLKKVHLELIKAPDGCSVIEGANDFNLDTFKLQLDFLFEQQLPVKKTVLFTQIPPSEFLKTEQTSYRQIVIIDQDERPSLPDHIECYNTLENLSFDNELILIIGGSENRHRIEKQMIKKVHPSTIMNINLNALKHNLDQFHRCLNGKAKIMLMIKAFAYGSDLKLMSQWLESSETVDYLGVAYVDEGVQLRECGNSHSVMVLNVDESGFETCREYNLEPVIYSIRLLEQFIDWIDSVKQNILSSSEDEQPSKPIPSIHIEIDTGMRRLGIDTDEMSQLLHMLKQCHHVTVKSIFSHLAASQDADEDSFTQEQASKFNVCAKQLEDSLGYSMVKHLCNSAAIIRHPLLHFDMVRLGIGLYGYTPSLTIQPAISLTTTLAQIRYVNKGTSIGYNRRTTVDRDSCIGTIRIGYSDGLNRKLSNRKGQVWIQCCRVPIVGNICMDMTMIDLTDIDVNNNILNETVEIFGKHISIDEVAEWCDTIPYEILTGIGHRVKRIYTEDR